MNEKVQILIIDDELDMREMLSYELSFCGYEVATAPDGTRGIELLRQKSFDLVLLDIKMPRVSGIEVLLGIKQLRQDTSVIMMTGHATVETAVESLRAGAADYILKPFELKQLHHVMARELEHRRTSALVAMYKAGLAIFTTHDTRTLIDKIVPIALEMLRADDAFLLLKDEDGVFVATRSYALDDATRPAGEKEGEPEAMARRVAALGYPVILPGGLRDEPSFIDVEEPGRLCPRIVYPLFSGEEVLGVLSIGRTAPEEPFGDQDLQKTTILASMIVLALTNILLVKELQRRVQELSDLQQQLIHSEKLAACGQLAASVAHEINNPSAFISANLEQLRGQVQIMSDFITRALEGDPTSELQRLAQENGLCGFLGEMKDIVKETTIGFSRIVDIVNDLRSFAHIGEKKTEPILLSSSIETALRLARIELQHRSQMITDLQPNVSVVGNQGQLSQVFLNLLLNAAQALPERLQSENKINVSLRTTGEWAEVTIADNGHGIAPEDLEKVFTPFFSTKQEKGTGLGLSISRDIVEKHGGIISVISTVGQGTCVTVKLPLASPDGQQRDTPPIPSTSSTSSTPSTPSTPQRAKILIVDDELSILKSLRRLLTNRHDVLIANSGHEAIEMIQKEKGIDVVVCDLLMPGCTGMQVYKEACQLNPALMNRFIFMSGDAFTSQSKDFAQQFIDWLVLKPFDMKKFEQLLMKRLAWIF